MFPNETWIKSFTSINNTEQFQFYSVELENRRRLMRRMTKCFEYTKSNPSPPSELTANIFDTSTLTVRQRLKLFGLRCLCPSTKLVLREAHMNACLAWAVAHERWYQLKWHEILCSDESRFQLLHADGRQRIWRTDGERYVGKCIRR